MCGKVFSASVFAALLFILPGAVSGQQTRPVLPPGLADVEVKKQVDAALAESLERSDPYELRGDAFRNAFVKAVVQARNHDRISRTEALRLRVRSFSPAFMSYAEDLAVTQLAFSAGTSEHVPVGEDGKIQRDGINWEGLLQFLEALIPLILQLIDALSYVEPAVEMMYAMSSGLDVPLMPDCPASLAA